MNGVAAALLAHPYLVLAPAVLVESPLATVVAGTLVVAGVISSWPALALAVLGDCLADSLWFALGRAGAPVPESLRARLFARSGITPDRWESVRERCRRRLPHLVGGARLVGVAAVPTFVELGASGAAYRRFISWIALTTAVESAVLLGLGWPATCCRPGRPRRRWCRPGAAVSVGTAVLVAAASWVVRRLRAPHRPPSRPPLHPATPA